MKDPLSRLLKVVDIKDILILFAICSIGYGANFFHVGLGPIVFGLLLALHVKGFLEWLR